MWQWILASILALIFFAKLSRRFKFYMKIFAGLIYSFLLPACCVLFSLFNPGSSYNMIVVQFFCRVLAMQTVFGLDVQVKDWHHVTNARRPFVIVSNHQSFLDVLLYVLHSPNGTSALAKKSLLYVPAFGVVSWLCGTVFIDRSKGSSAREVMRQVGLQMKTKVTSLWIFPEGSRHQEGKVFPFKKGAFHLAIQAQVPIIPVVIGNNRNVIDAVNHYFDGGEIRMKACEPIETDGLTSQDVDDLLQKVYKIISDEYDNDYRNHVDIYRDVLPIKKD